MSRYAGTAGVLVVLALSILFTAWNGTERVTLDLGFATFYRVPLTWVVFGGLTVGMLIMLAAGLHADLRVRKILRDRFEREAEEERRRMDPHQKDLFGPEEE